MDIGIDFTSVDPGYAGGVNSYAVGVARGLRRVCGEHRVRLFVTPRQSGFISRRCPELGGDLVMVPDRGPWHRRLRELAAKSAYVLPKSVHRLLADRTMRSVARTMDAGADVICVPTTVLYPYTFRKPTLLSMHDLQHVHYPEFFTPLVRKRRKIEFALSAERATYFQASSEFMKAEFLAQFPALTERQLVVIPEGVSIEEFARPQPEAVLARHNLPRDFLFFPAQLWPHKNHLTVLKALKRLEQEQGVKLPLVLTGAPSTGSRAIVDFIRNQSMDYVHYLGKVDFGELIALYQRARFFITAVLYESSSLPFLEAAAAGCPVIASGTPPNQEMARKLHANLFSPLDDAELARLLSRIWGDEARRREQIAHNRNSIDYYSWDNAGRRHLAFLERLKV